MSKLPTVGRAAYWAAYRELLKQGWADWWRVWVVTQVGFLVAFAVHYFWLKKQIDAVANLEVHVVYVVFPSLLGLLGLFVLNLFVASWRMAKSIQTTRDQRIKELEEEVSSQRARVQELDAKLNPPDATRMAGAKRLLRDARDEAFKRAAEKEKLAKEEMEAFFGDANRLVFRVLMKGKYTKTFNDRIMNPSKSKRAAPWELAKEMGADLSFFVEEMKFCPLGYTPDEDEEHYPYLRLEFTPVEGRSWREYPDEEATNPTLKLRLEKLIAECKESRDRGGSFDADAERMARRISRMCDAFPHEPCLNDLRDERKGSFRYPPEGYSLAANKWLNRAHQQLEDALDTLEYPGVR